MSPFNLLNRAVVVLPFRNNSITWLLPFPSLKGVFVCCQDFISGVYHPPTAIPAWEALEEHMTDTSFILWVQQFAQPWLTNFFLAVAAWAP